MAEHNLITFKSHHEALDAWAMKELIGHYVAYRKLVSPSPARLYSEDCFRLYAVCARFPQNLSGQAPWQVRQAGLSTEQIRQYLERLTSGAAAEPRKPRRRR